MLLSYSGAHHILSLQSNAVLVRLVRRLVPFCSPVNVMWALHGWSMHESWMHAKAFMLRRIESGPVARVARAVAEVLASCEAKGVITPQQRHSLTAEIAGKLQGVL